MPPLAKALVLLAALPGWQAPLDSSAHNPAGAPGSFAPASSSANQTYSDYSTAQTPTFDPDPIVQVAEPAVGSRFSDPPQRAPAGDVAPPAQFDPNATGAQAPVSYTRPVDYHSDPRDAARYEPPAVISARPMPRGVANAPRGLHLPFTVVPRAAVARAAGERSFTQGVATAEYLHDPTSTEPQVVQVALSPSQGDEPIPLSPPSRGKTPSGASQLGKSSGTSLWGVAGSLAVVVGLFLIIAWVARRSLPRGSRPLPKEVVEVLGRAPLGARQQMHLVRVGRKLLLLSVSAGGSETLTEVTDPDEVERLCTLVQQDAPGGATTTFRNVLAQLGREPAPAGFLGNEPPFDLNSEPNPPRGQVAGGASRA